MPPDSRRIVWALGAITLLGGALRLYGLATHSLWYDETSSLLFGERAVTWSRIASSEWLMEVPGMAVISAAWTLLVEAVHPGPRYAWSHDFLIRLLPWTLGTLSIPLLYLVGRRWTGAPRAALAAAVLFAVNPFQVYYAQEFRSYAVLVVLWLGVAALLHTALHANRTYAWVGLVLLQAASLNTNFVTLWYAVALHLFFVVWWLVHRRHLARWTAWHVLFVVLSLPAVASAMRLVDFFSEKTIDWFEPLTVKTGVITFKALFAGYGFTPWAYWPAFLFGGLLAVWGFVRLARARPLAAALFVLLCGLPIAVNWTVWYVNDYSWYQHRSFIVSGAFVLLLCGYAFAAPRPAGLLRHLPHALAAGLLLSSLPLLRDVYHDNLHPIDSHRVGAWEKVAWRPAAAYIDAHWQPGDFLARSGHFSTHSMHWYLPDHPQTRVGLAEGGYAATLATWGPRFEVILAHYDMLPTHVAEATAGAKRVWFIEPTGIHFDWQPTAENLRAWFEENARFVTSQAFDGVRVSLYALEPLVDDEHHDTDGQKQVETD